MMELTQEMNDTRALADSTLKDQRESGSYLAQKQRDYAILRAKKTLERKAQGYPATLIPKLVDGDEEVANLEFEMNCAEVMYKADQKAHDKAKLDMRYLMDMMNREWTQR